MSRLPEQIFRALNLDVQTETRSLPGNENENWLLIADGRSFVVKKLRGHSASNTELEGVYRRILASDGLPVVPYLLLKGNECVLTVGQNSYVATVYIEGKTTKPEEGIISQAAVLLARTHLLTASELPERQNWYCQNYIPNSIGLIDDIYVDAKRAFVAQLAEYPDFWNGELPKGIIHGDLQEDNIIEDEQGNIASAIDWEETGVEPLLLDVAHSAQQLSFNRGICNHELFNTFIGAYQNVRTLTDLEKKQFDSALRYTMLVLSVWAHIKKSRSEMDDGLFLRLGGYYKASYITPKVG